MTKLLGYINNLVERDGVKVLFVANENEILNKAPETFSSISQNILYTIRERKGK